MLRRCPSLLILAMIVTPLSTGCGEQPSGDQPACFSGPTVSPQQWVLMGEAPWDYAISSDAAVTLSGAPTETMVAIVSAPTDFGTVMQTLDPTPFLGQRVTFRAQVKTSAVAKAGLWMKVVADVGHKDETVAFYNMDDRPLVGTQDWTLEEVTLDVPSAADWLSLGLWQDGSGQVWLDEVELVTCGPDAGTADAR